MRERKKKNEWSVAEVQVSYKPKDRTVKIHTADDAYQVFKQMWDDDLISLQEQTCVIFLNRANEVIGFRCLHTGSNTSSVVDIKLLFTLCCKLMAQGIILAHNHPSGNLKASMADNAFTKQVREACRLFDVQLMDHLIITNKSYNTNLKWKSQSENSWSLMVRPFTSCRKMVTTGLPSSLFAML